MARQQSSPFEDLIIITSKLPWKVSVTLAVISFVTLHGLASRPAVRMTNPGQMGDVVSHTLVTTLAMFGQFILPLAFLVGAIVSVVQGAKQRKLYEFARSGPNSSVLNDMCWEEFESLVGEYFRRDGFHVTRKGGNGSDGGVDLVLRRGNEKHLVQCKQWRSYKVSVQPVREFYGVMAASGAAHGYFVTSGVFTDDARKFVQGLNLELIDGKKLKTMIGFAANKEPAPFGTSEPEPTGVQIGSSQKMKTCPHCGTELVLRKFQSGPKEGQPFLGCIPCRKGWPVEGT